MVGTVDHFVAEMARKEAPPPPEMSEFDKRLFRNAVRLDIPLDLPLHQLADLADKLHGLANSIAFHAKRPDLPERGRRAEIMASASEFRSWARRLKEGPKWG